MDEQQDTTELLDAIIWGRRIVDVFDHEDQLVTYVLRPLSLEERNMGNYIHKRALGRAKDAGHLTRDELTKQAIDKDLWKATYEEDLKKLRSELAIQLKLRDEEMRTKMLDSKGRPKRQSPTAKLKKLNNKIASITKTVRELEATYTQHIELPSVEYRAEQERGDYFLRCATLSFPEMTQVWDTMEELKREEDTILIGRLMREYYNDSLVDEAAIRRIARSGFWRCKWMASKKNRGVKTLFDREMYDLTLDQFRLVYWSQVYDSAFESMEAPSDKVIDNDDLFDKWLEQQHQKREAERKKSEFDKQFAKNDKKANANEVGFNIIGEYCWECHCGVKDEADERGADKRGHMHAPECPYGVFLYYDEETKRKKVEEVQSANPENVRKILASEQKRLAEVGADGMEEQHLRGDKTRSVLGLGTSYHSKGEPGKGKQGRASPN